MPNIIASCPPKQRFDSPQGWLLIKSIVNNHHAYEPHDYIMDGVCAVLDGYDLLATTPTGSRKTSFFSSTCAGCMGVKQGLEFDNWEGSDSRGPCHDFNMPY